MPTLGVNIDHIANVREARKTIEPDPVQMAFLAELGGADGITVHLREDRRHIQDRDLRLLRETLHTKLNLEMASTAEMLEIALKVKPDMVTLVPEKRNEVTTEGGLDIKNHKIQLKEIIKELQLSQIPTSLFIDAEPEQIEASVEVNATYVELHTGCYALAQKEKIGLELAKLKEAAARATNIGLHVNAGHGLTYQNVVPIALINQIDELNIGHTIVARSIAVGLIQAVKEMQELIKNPISNHFKK